MSTSEQRHRRAALIVVIACVLATAALTLLFAVVPELSDDAAGNALFWLAA